MIVVLLSILLYSYFLFEWHEGILYKLIVGTMYLSILLYPNILTFSIAQIVLLGAIFIYIKQPWYEAILYILISSILWIGIHPSIYYVWMLIQFSFYVRKNNYNIMFIFAYIVLSFALYLTNTHILILWLISLLLLAILNLSDQTNQKKWKVFEENVWTKHYEEMKVIYKDMRGFRHDFHNHAHVIKGYIAQERYQEAKNYVDELVDSYEEFDSQINSGNLLVDAIMNAKLQMAKSEEIQCTVEANLPEELYIKESDLVIIIGNAFDNAIESCRKLEEDKQWIKVYISIFKNQFYFSIMNGSVEKFDSKTKFITEKRGDHGHGISRMKQCVEKYEGYFNINQEEGVFGLEVMIPLPLVRDI